MAICASILGFACSEPDRRARLQERPPENFLLITIDTLRADRVGAYGHGAARTPNLDRLAKEGVQFYDAVAPAPLTLPAHTSIFTGLYPVSHGLHTNGRQRLTEDIPTLAELLSQRQPRRGALVASVSLDSVFGLARGFVDYDDRMPGSGNATVYFQGERRGDEMAKLAVEWLGRETTPFFLWVHLFDPHDPYEAPAPWNERLDDAYDAEVAFADEAVGTILDSLRAQGLLERTLVVVAGDHGESL
ncbi:MAG: sulfatase, partial [Planctomycetota bacterium]